MSQTSINANKMKANKNFFHLLVLASLMLMQVVSATGTGENDSNRPGNKSELASNSKVEPLMQAKSANETVLDSKTESKDVLKKGKQSKVVAPKKTVKSLSKRESGFAEKDNNSDMDLIPAEGKKKYMIVKKKPKHKKIKMEVFEPKYKYKKITMKVPVKKLKKKKVKGYMVKKEHHHHH